MRTHTWEHKRNVFGSYTGKDDFVLLIKSFFQFFPLEILVIMRVSSSYLFASTIALVSTISHGCGMFEFFNWNVLPEEVKEAAMDLGYDEMSWRDIRTNPIERLRFADLLDLDEMGGTIDTLFGSFTPETDDLKGALMDLDFDIDGVCWDYWINHYDGYEWDDLEGVENPFGLSVKELLETLGWDQESWDDKEGTTEIPESECSFWLTLDPMQKWAYTQLGWDPVSFGSAPCGMFYIDLLSLKFHFFLFSLIFYCLMPP